MKETRSVCGGRLVRGWLVVVAVAVVAAGWSGLGTGVGVAVAEDTPSAVNHMMDETKLVAATMTGGLSDHGAPRLMDVATGDLNGDGLGDLVVGAPGYDVGGLAGGGSVFVVLGRKDMALTAASAVDLSEIKHFDLRIDASEAGTQLGTRVAVADVTGDGVDDIVMTAPGGRGAVYIKAGAKADAGGEGGLPRGVVSLAQDQAFDWSFEGAREGAMQGAVLCVGDLNSDKYADLVFGSLEFDDMGNVSATALYAVPGRVSWSRRAYEGDERVPGRVRLVRALGQHTRAMHTCALGDLDDNGTGDLVAGMPLDNLSSRPEVGSVAVVFDVLTRSLGTVDLGDPAAAFGLRLVGDQAGGRFGYTLAVSDLNGDHRADLAVGVPGRTLAPSKAASKDDESATPTPPEGMVMLFWGRFHRGHPPKAPSRVLVGTPQAPIGQAMTVLDLVDDAAADLVLMSPSAAADVGPGAGQVDVYASGVHMHDPGAETEAGRGGIAPSLRLIGGFAQQRIGWSIATADMNGDGRREWVLRNAWHPLGRSTAGSVAVFSAPEGAKAHTSKTQEILFDDALNPLTLLGPGRGGGLTPRLVASADLDADGIPDPIWISPEGQGRGGVACVQRSTMTPQIAARSVADADGCDLRLVTPAGTRLTSLSVGDFNGDRTVDFAVGMDNHTVNGQPVGAVVVVPLPAPEVRVVELGQDPKAQWWWSGGPGSEGLGVDVRLSDLNADGVDDLIMAADRATFEDYERAGALLVVLGGTDLKPGARSAALNDSEDIFLRLEGAEGSRLGPGSQVLDFDADGASDLMVPAPSASPAGRLQAGAVYVIYSVARLKTGRYAMEDEAVSALRLMGPSQGSFLEHFTDVTDLDGDGIDDLLLQAPLAVHEGGVRGSIHVIYGRRERIGPFIDLGQREGNDLVIVGERLSGRLTGPAVGDINGDGARDLVVAAQWAGLLETGRVYVLLADRTKSFKGYVRLDQPGHVQHIIHGTEPHAGLSLPSMLPDLNNDGRHELWLISQFADAARSDQGRAFQVILAPEP